MSLLSLFLFLEKEKKKTRKKPHKKGIFLGGRVGYFLFFFLLGKGEGGVRGARRGGIHFLLKIPGGGGFSRRGRGAGRVSAANLGNLEGGGGQFFFFSAPKGPPSLSPHRTPKIPGEGKNRSNKKREVLAGRKKGIPKRQGKELLKTEGLDWLMVSSRLFWWVVVLQCP